MWCDGLGLDVDNPKMETPMLKSPPPTPENSQNKVEMKPHSNIVESTTSLDLSNANFSIGPGTTLTDPKLKNKPAPQKSSNSSKTKENGKPDMSPKDG